MSFIILGSLELGSPNLEPGLVFIPKLTFTSKPTPAIIYTETNLQKLLQICIKVKKAL